jgi:TetR/AcrR family transcriptional repressor of lmrAB and yxaGH operons
MRKGDATRARMVETTARLLQAQGYHGTGLGQVLSEARAPKGSLYFHFPGGKEALAAEALRRAADAWRDAVLAVVEAAPRAADAVVALCDLLAARLEASGFADGCPIATVALEAAPTSDAIHETCAAAYGSWQAVIEARLRRDGRVGARARRQATLVLAAIEGALVLSKAGRSAAPLRRVGTELRAILKGRAGPPTGR